ncbi:MAG: hemolysin family protein [Lentisphaeria bacterium]|nr:hemolysin family protein [Lentisphaeria bacterium]
MEDDSTLFFQLLFLFCLILLNAFFAASEVAVISLSPGVLKKLEQKRSTKARHLKNILADYGRFLATVQVGVTFAGFMASAFAADIFSDTITEFLYDHGVTFLSKKILDGLIVVFITLVLSYVSLVFGELIPKQLGLKFSETVAVHVATPIDYFARLTRPFVWLLNNSVKQTLQLFGCSMMEAREVSEEEIRSMVDIGAENGAIENDERRMIENIFEFNTITAGEVMTHRSEVVALKLDTPAEKIEELFFSSVFTRIPVYKNDIDEIIGFVHFREYMTAKIRAGKSPDLAKVLHPVFFAPATMRANALFHSMQGKKIGMSVILDEFGGADGIVTLEDLLEEIVGSLYDEGDESGNEIEPIAANKWRIDGAVRLDEISRNLNLSLDGENFDTIGGLVFGKLNTIPAPGATVELPELNLHITVEKITERRVDKIVLEYIPPPESTDAEDCF